MLNYLKRLNWEGFFIMFLICGLGAMSRKQDKTIMDSIFIWLIVGLPISLLFLFIGIKPKK